MENINNRHFFGSLDALRGIAAVLVIVHNIGWIFPGYENGAILQGYLAVDFFFVLSGFVIYHSYGKRLKTLPDLGRFIWLRIGRLFPLHLFFLMAFVGIEFVRYIAQNQFGITPNFPLFSTNNWSTFISNLFLVQSLGLHDYLSFNVPAWSISVEFATYMIFAALLMLFVSRGRFFVVAAAVSIASYAAISLVGKTNFDFNYDYGILRCTGGFFLGVLTYIAYEKLTAQARSTGHVVINPGVADNLLAPVIIVCLATFLIYKPYYQLDLAFIPLSAITILIFALSPHTLFSKLLNHSAFTKLGSWSYSIYLSHFAVFWVFNQALRLVFDVSTKANPVSGKPVIQTEPMIGLAAAGLAVLTVIIVSRFTYEWIEKPARAKARQLVDNKEETAAISVPEISKMTAPQA